MLQRIAIVISFVAALLLATPLQADTSPAPDTQCDCAKKGGKCDCPKGKGAKCGCPKCKAGKSCPKNKGGECDCSKCKGPKDCPHHKQGK